MNEVELTQLGIKDSRDLLNKKEISATELTNAYIQNIERAVKNTEVYGGFYQREISQIMKEFFEARRVRFDGYRY